MAKKSEKSFLPKDLSDLLNESQYMKNSPKPKKVTKRQQKLEEVENGFNTEYGGKKKKAERSDDHREARQKLLDVMGRQLETRKQNANHIMSSLSEFLGQLEADHSVLAENEQKLQHMVAAMYKCVQQSTAAAKMKIKTLKEICSGYKRNCDEQDSEHKAQNVKLAEELEDHMIKLQQRLVNDTKKQQLENLKKSIFHAMQDDF